MKIIRQTAPQYLIPASLYLLLFLVFVNAQDRSGSSPPSSKIPDGKFDFALAPKVNVATLEELYSAVNDSANANSQIVIAPGVYVLSNSDAGGVERPNGGRLELQENMALLGVAGNRGAVVIDASNLPASSYNGELPSTGAIRMGRGTNAIEWLTFKNAIGGGVGIIVHLSAPGTAHVRIAHCVSTGNHRGIDIRNAAGGATGYIIVAEIIDNDLYNNRISTGQGLRIINLQGVNGNSVSAYLSGNRLFGNQHGLLVENIGSTNGGIVSVYSAGDRFFDNAGGAFVGGALGPTNNSSVNFTAVGSVFENNNGSSNFFTGGLIVAGGASFPSPNVGSNNTADVVLRNCRFSNNQVADLAVYGSASLPLTIGPAGTNNFANVRLLGTPTANVIIDDSSPANPAGMNSAKVIRGSTVPNFDYDGDGRADLSVFRPTNRTWYINGTQNGFGATPFGLATDEIVPADFDGDGKNDIAVFRDGVWYWLNSSNYQVNVAQFGITGDFAQPADFDGDGRSELVVYRQSDFVWYAYNLATTRTTTTESLQFTQPLVGDYDGDGIADHATYGSIASGLYWSIRLSSGGYFEVPWGVVGDKIVPADYDGDLKTDLAVFRPSNGNWYIRRSSTNTLQVINWGLASDTLVPADYDGDGKADAAVYRNGKWWVNQSNNGVAVQHFGLNADKPLPASFLP